MVSATAALSVVAGLAASISQINSHDYMNIPLAEFTDSVTSAWVVQIEPQWTGELGQLHDIRTLPDSDNSLYGANCGFTDPNATPKDPPTIGDATFSCGMMHIGSCEIWLDDTMVLSSDDCQAAYRDDTQEKASVFTPIDCSLCSSSGYMLRFYWLAFQGVDSKVVWQVYKDCVPLTGPASGTSSTPTNSTSTATDSSLTLETSTSSGSTTESSTTKKSPSTDAPQTTTSTPTTTEASTDTTTDAPSSTLSPS
ncbi:hypothetical protein G195_007488 [Phytophthora kernoviae 00238/432]|nr:hypothetical protein G195_007488 [Phytophthora kernoviae 00238/432]